MTEERGKIEDILNVKITTEKKTLRDQPYNNELAEAVSRGHGFAAAEKAADVPAEAAAGEAVETAAHPPAQEAAEDFAQEPTNAPTEAAAGEAVETAEAFAQETAVNAPAQEAAVNALDQEEPVNAPVEEAAEEEVDMMDEFMYGANGEEVKAPRRRKKEEGKVNSNVKLILKDILIACLVALVISFFIRPTIVRETSMLPTVEPSDYLIMSRQAYRFGELERGDIVIFRSDLKLDETHNKLLIKRVIALPGDTLAVHDGFVYLNGDRIEESYIAPGGTTGYVEEMTIPEGEVFVMGDHREVSQDSRSFGTVDQEDIVGQAIFRLYPFDRFGKLE